MNLKMRNKKYFVHYLIGCKSTLTPSLFTFYGDDKKCLPFPLNRPLNVDNTLISSKRDTKKKNNNKFFVVDVPENIYMTFS